ncbi:helix-turn-helix domain-containing protein [Patulibacter sp.]|uniref:helix-turn-helix domain-containing protein n=1 Tax=Patulibacter sp. TaxID=1912859 RepID=UPI0027175C3A|nr:helix-turn-helix domain-containing protein [Patulibacter sp.]MDO9409603.1 hypothetical protein [Patulibacter sp.]
MHPSWLAIHAGMNLRGHTEHLSRVRAGALDGAGAPDVAASGSSRSGGAPLRQLIVQSWRRSRLAGVDPAQALLPHAMSRDDAAERWEHHPLHRIEPLLRDLFGEIARETNQMAMVCDRDGTLLWRLGAPGTLDAADELDAVPGSRWSEAAAGTNAIGAALAERHPLQVFSAEHYAAPLDGWMCSAAPILDPGSGAPLGVVNLTGHAATAHPHSLGLVCAAAAAVRPHLAGAEPADGGAAVHLRVLRGDHPVFLTPDGPVPLTLRHAEILTLLAARPEGWTAEQLALELHGERGKPVSVRAEITRLQQRLGDVVRTRPYRLADGIAWDVAAAGALLDEGRPHAALDLYGGTLLARSEVPMIDDLRRELDARVSRSMATAADPSVLERWLGTGPGCGDVGAQRRLDLLHGASPTVGPGAATGVQRRRP